MHEYLLKLLFALLPIPFFFLIYYGYFRRDTIWLDHLEAFLYGVLLATILVALKVYFGEFYQKSNPFSSGFIGAAIPEKTGAFICIFIFLSKRRSSLTVMQGMVMSMMFGLGFSSLENIIYAYASQSSVMLVRFFSAVPLHVYTDGILGFFLSISMLCAPSFKRRGYLLFSLAIPILLHGFFDASLFSGGFNALYIAPLIVLMNAIVVYMLARSETLPGMKKLTESHIQYSDWIALEREPQYERWIMRSSGINNAEEVKFLHWGLERRNLLILFISGGVILLIAPLHEVIYDLLLVNLSVEEQWTLLLGLPLSYIISILSAGIVNPEYFKNNIIKIPIIADVDYFIGETKYAAITYDITDNNTLLKTMDAVPENSSVRMIFNFDRYFSPEIKGKIIWDSHDENSSFGGTIVRFDSIPDGFVRFLFRYYVFKVSRGLSYNLRLPGFEGIRKFFIRPLSLMQNERRYDAGAVIFEEGDPGKHFFLIKKGIVEIYKNLKGGEKIILNTLYQGDIFGEMAIVGKQNRSASALCRTDCILAVAEGDNMEALIKSNPEFTQKIIQELARRILFSETIMKKGLTDMESSLEDSEVTVRLLLAAILYESDVITVSKKGIGFKNNLFPLSLMKKNKIKINPDDIKKLLKGEINLRQFSGDFIKLNENPSHIHDLMNRINKSATL